MCIALYYICSKNDLLEYCIIYFFKKNVGYDFLKLAGAKRPGDEISEGRNRLLAKSP